MKKLRFQQPMYSIYSFSENILVKCPQCEGLCSVKTKLGKYGLWCGDNNTSSLYCQECGYTTHDKEKWFGYFQGILKMHCGFCGTKIHYTSKPTKNPLLPELVECKFCKVEKTYPLVWERYKGKETIDPYFGLELWLQTEVKNNTLWVYNTDHIKYLQDYLQSTLREDDTRHKYSMVSNLPKWIKLAKNRNLVLKKLKILEKQSKHLKGNDGI